MRRERERETRLLGGYGGTRDEEVLFCCLLVLLLLLLLDMAGDNHPREEWDKDGNNSAVMKGYEYYDSSSSFHRGSSCEESYGRIRKKQLPSKDGILF
jgi:hypothetical protein